jgi:predicted nucleotidyltransferase
LPNKTLKALNALFQEEDKVLVAYLFGSYAKGIQTIKSDIDIAILLKETPQKMLDYYLRMTSKLSQVLKSEVDLIVLNTAPPLLKYQVIKHGKLIHSKDEEARIKFEAKTQDEYLDFSRAMARYDECLIKETLK